MPGKSTLRPVDAAGIVLIRADNAGEPEILLGRRHSKAGFLPGIFVVPGGRVEPSDCLPSGMEERIHGEVGWTLGLGSGGRPPLAFARCALRETLEETGLLIGHKQASATDKATIGPVAPNSPWNVYRAMGIRPGFEALDFVFRAITPTYMPRRFNTRFFLADGALAKGEIKGDGELEDLAWWPAASLGALNLVDVTQALLKESIGRWRRRVGIGTEEPKLLTYLSNKLRLRPVVPARSRPNRTRKT